MSLPNTILSFGDFNEGDEDGSLNHLLISLGRPLTNENLELPWNEGEHLKELTQDSVPDAAAGIGFGNVENYSFTVGRSSSNSPVEHNAIEFDNKVYGQSQLDDNHRKPRRNKKKRDEKYYQDFYKNQEFGHVDKNEPIKNQRYLVEEKILRNEPQEQCMKNADVVNTATAGARTLNHEQCCMPDLIPNIASTPGVRNVQQNPIPTGRHTDSTDNVRHEQPEKIDNVEIVKPVSNNADNNTKEDDANKETEDISQNTETERVDKTELVSTNLNQQRANEPKETAVPSAPRQPAAPKLSSWAGLFSKPSVKGKPNLAENRTQGVPESAKQIVLEIDDTKPVSVDFDSYAKQLGDILSKVQLNHRPVAWQPRGLNNRANWCYINSILQALLFCPPFGNLIKSIPVQVKERLPTSTPMLDCIIDFVNMYDVLPHRQSGKRVTDISTGSTFEPVQVYQMLSRAKTSFSVEGRQEDAEEFLGCLLNGMHEEMLALASVGKTQTKGFSNGPAGLENDNEQGDEEEDEDEWRRVGPKNKSSVTREAHFDKSLISDIFGGQMRSILHQSGSCESATLQPFFTLQLDIQSSNIWTVADALEHMVSKETLQGYTCSKTKTEVEASRRITLEKLPPVLILHLKRFIYDKSGGCQKMMKRIDYSVDLELGKELFSSTVKGKLSVSQRLYKLFAVVYHLGEEASGGHYITDVFHPTVGGWLRTDDSMVKVVPVSQVLKPSMPRLPYLLFYRQRDL